MQTFIVGVIERYLDNSGVTWKKRESRVTVYAATKGEAANNAITLYNQTHRIPSYEIAFIMTPDERLSQDTKEEKERQEKEEEKKRARQEHRAVAKKAKANI